MFRDEERIEAEVFDFPRDRCDISGLGGGRDHDPYFHCRIPPRDVTAHARTSWTKPAGNVQPRMTLG
jgi:hypothetical protein